MDRWVKFFILESNLYNVKNFEVMKTNIIV